MGKWGNEKVRDYKCWSESGQLREELLDFLRVAGRIGCHALAEGVDGRTEVVQLGVVDDHEAVVKIVGIGLITICDKFIAEYYTIL